MLLPLTLLTKWGFSRILLSSHERLSRSFPILEAHMSVTLSLTAGTPTVPGPLSLDVSIAGPSAGEQYIVTANPPSLVIDTNDPTTPMFEIPASPADPHVQTITVDATGLPPGDTVTVTVTDPSGADTNFDITLTAPVAPPGGGGGGSGGGGTGSTGGTGGTGGGGTTTPAPAPAPTAVPPRWSININLGILNSIFGSGGNAGSSGTTGTSDGGGDHSFRRVAILTSAALCLLIIGGGVGLWVVIDHFTDRILTHESAVSTDVDLMAKCVAHMGRESAADLSHTDLMVCQADLLAQELRTDAGDGTTP